jgi:isoaspartyl peptidase/L-asparaginase-like protein (Ntn-hydrolase superfamily)
MAARNSFAMVLHGGAGVIAVRDYDGEVAHMLGLIEAGRARLAAGASSLDVVTETVEAMELSGLYVAGRGASPNSAGRFELDASVMEGPTRRAGAVAALEGFASPVRVARAVMEETPHVMLAGAGAAAFAGAHSFARVDADWFTPVRMSAPLATGTVGCVALDMEGGLAAATSTGGVRDKLFGRVGDSPIIGAGTWADAGVAVSCTGAGEFFVRASAASQVAFRMSLAAQSVEAAAEATLADIRTLGGTGGLIALSGDGAIAMPFTTAGMKRAALHSDGRIEAAVFSPPPLNDREAVEGARSCASRIR